MTEAWPPGNQQAIGQTGEFLVWATLIAQSVRPDGSSEASKVDAYRLPLESLAPEISSRLG